MSFSYIGKALGPDEFVRYVATYDFGSIPPSYVVMHHTYNPDASWAPISSNQSTWWDRNEAGLDASQVMSKRKPQLDSIMAYYRDSKGWTTGPHLFVDERWIWLFTPMYEIGTHAASGNSYKDANGKLHYSIGVECVGYFEYHGWPASMQRLLQVAVQSLKARLGNFEIKYVAAPVNRPDLHDHSISFHRDYNKPECPGGVVTPEYAIPILAEPFAHAYVLYEVVSPCAVLTGPSGDAPLAQGAQSGQVWLDPGTLINTDQLKDGWLHVAPNATDRPGIGFIPASYARRV